MSRIWVTSDTHFSHSNISGFNESKWKSGYRDFENTHEMNKILISGINNNVKEDDILYHLGDFSFGGKDKIWEFRKRLNVKTIHLIYGNHDNHIKDNKVLPNVIGEEGNTLLFNREELNHDHIREVKAQELFTSCNDVLTVKHGKHTFFLSHYSHRCWLGSHKGIIHLWGHSHNSLPMWGKSMDVGIDVAKAMLGEYRPFSIEEIISIMDKREVKFVDNHKSDTNI